MVRHEADSLEAVRSESEAGWPRTSEDVRIGCSDYKQSWVECVGILILRHSVQLRSAGLNIPSLFNSAELNA